MKPTKLLITILLVAFAVPALAQKADVYTLLSGGTTAIPATSTNRYITTTTNLIGSPGTSSNLVRTVSEFDVAGITWIYVNSAAGTNATAGLRIYRSNDKGITFESTPSWVLTNTPVAPGSLTTKVVTNLHIPAETHLAFTIENATAGHLTNVLLKVNLKAPKRIVRTGTQ